MIVHDARTLATARWPDTAEGRLAAGYLSPLVTEGAATFFSDVTTFRVVSLDDLLIPIAVNESEYDNSYSTSIFTRYIGQARKNLSQPALGWNPVVATLVGALLGAIGGFLKASRINRCVYVGCWMIFRGLDPHLSPAQAERLTELLVTQYPGHAIVFGALNPLTHQGLLESLRGAGYRFLFAGQTRMRLPHDAPVSRKERENRRRDGRLYASSGYTITDAESVPQEGLAARLAALYSALNREKYATNTAVTTTFFERALSDRLLTLRLLCKDGRVDGFYGYTVHEGVLFPPVFGYDTSLPQELGLYRMLYYLLIQDAIELGLAIETGGGADKFKSVRGDRPVPRYGAFYVRHLSALRRAAWKVLETYVNGPYLSSTRGYLRRCDGDDAAGFDAVPPAFVPPAVTPEHAVAAQREELDALERAIEEAATLEGPALAKHTAALSAKLDNWQEPPRRVTDLKGRLASVVQRARRLHRAAAEQGAASSTVSGAAEALLERAEKRGGVTLVVGELGAADHPQLRAAASAVLRKAAPAAVFFASAREGKVVLLAAMTPSLCAEGLGAGALVALAAPCVGGKGGGGPELAFGGGSRVEGIAEAVATARGYLVERLAAR